jgi:6-phosphofructokinase 1
MDSMPLVAGDFEVPTLGAPVFSSPLPLTMRTGDGAAHFVREDARVALEVECELGATAPRILLEKAGPRAKLFYEPSRARVGLVTCGGLSPGINNVIRAVVLELHHHYGVPAIFGFRYGFDGLDAPTVSDTVRLGPDDVRLIHKQGGSVLGLSRGRHDTGAIVDTLMARCLTALIAVGGDGTIRGALAIHREIAKRGLPIAVVAVPKTIDNDIPFVDKTFGFDTAVELARSAIDAAHVEATGARNGIGLVKLMGRDSGFIAAAATLASDDVNVCLVPEVPFAIDGEHGLLAALERRLRARSHAVVVVAEGCGAALVGGVAERDPSGNVRYAAPSADIGMHLRDVIKDYFRGREFPMTLKYIDPSYMVRAVPANASDSLLCDALGRHAAHAAMTGKTGVLIGRVHGVFTHVPLAAAARERKRIDPEGAYWLSIVEATGQEARGDRGHAPPCEAPA